MSALIEDVWIFIFASAFIILWYIVLAEVYEENVASYIVGKGRSNFSFLDDCDLFLILYQNLTNGSFLNCEIWNYISEPFYFITLKSMAMLCTLNGSVTHIWFYNIKLGSSGKYWFIELCKSSKCWHVSLYNIKISLVDSTTHLKGRR